MVPILEQNLSKTQQSLERFSESVCHRRNWFIRLAEISLVLISGSAENSGWLQFANVLLLRESKVQTAKESEKYAFRSKWT